MIPLFHLARERFFYDQNRQHLQLLDKAARQSCLSRGEVFSDFLHMAVCCLSGGQLEDQYMQVVKRHSEGSPGKRSCDTIAQLFGAIVSSCEDTQDGIRDILGDLFEGGVSYGENGLFLSPQPLCQTTASLSLMDVEDDSSPKSVCDPCCGSGRMLLAVAERHRHWEFVGQDVDIRCVRITALNLALRNLYGYVIHGDSLRMESKLVYRTGFNGRGFVREVPPESVPYALFLHESRTERPEIEIGKTQSPDADEDQSPAGHRQQRLF